MKNSTARKLKHILEGYLLVGVDPHKKKHAAVAPRTLWPIASSR
jgi:hypothetical protein